MPIKNHSSSAKRYFVTTSLPYANGPLHLGHMLELLQADIWVRFQRMQGHECVFVSGDDIHGSAIMLAAQKLGIDPQDYVAGIYKKHKNDIERFGIGYDLFGSTGTNEHKIWVEYIYQKLKEADLFEEKSILQSFDDQMGMFLPDRYVKGTCPKCGAQDQYGDCCEVCGAVYGPQDLKDAYSVLSGQKPSLKTSKHLFLRLDKVQGDIEHWHGGAQIHSQVANKLKEWLDAGLMPWGISRDGPYFGIEIPDRKNQYFYVWMDAPVGYIALCKTWSDLNKNDTFADIWLNDGSDWQVVHFIGKDIVNFHGIFWPAMLKHAGLKTPDALHVHGFLTISGEKMSKSRGTFITADDYLSHFRADHLRYYFASKLNDGVRDIDLDWQDFVTKNNVDLIGKIINIGSRTSPFIQKYFGGVLTKLDDDVLLNEVLLVKDEIAQHYEANNTHMAIRLISKQADVINRYIDEHKPWSAIKNPDMQEQVALVCSQVMCAFRLLTIYLTPVLPEISQQVASIFDEQDYRWSDLSNRYDQKKIKPLPRLLERLDLAQILSHFVDKA